jgi:hypothetical protein
MDKLQKSLVETIHKGALDVSDLAEAWGLTENSIYKMGLEDSGLLKALRRISSLMMLQKRHDILKALAGRHDFLLVKVPRVAKDKREESELVQEYQELTTKAIGLLIKFFADPTEECREKLMGALTDVTERSLAIKKRIANGNQLDIFTSEQ